MCAKQVTSIRVDSRLWKRAKIAAIEEGTTLSRLIEEALSAVVDWRSVVEESGLDVDEELLKKMLSLRQQGELPFTIVTEKTAVELVKEGRSR